MKKHGLNELLRLANKLGIGVSLGAETEFKSLPKTIGYVRLRKVIKRKSSVTLKLTIDQLLDSSDPKDITADRLAHELGHFIAAPKARRNKTDYGIKEYPNSSKFAELDEFKANFVERELRYRFGLRNYRFDKNQKKRPEYKQAENWWLSEGQFVVLTLLEFLM